MVFAHIERVPLLAGRLDHQDRLTGANILAYLRGDDISYGGGGAVTDFFCRFLASEETYNPLMLTLPKALKIDVRRGGSREWIEASVRFAAGELAEGRLATSSVMARLSESLLTEAIRQHSSTLAEEDMGWLKGLRDPQVGRALALVHQRISAPWSVETLAREVA